MGPTAAAANPSPTHAMAKPRTVWLRRSKFCDRPLLKVKLGSDDDGKRIAAVRRAAPRAELIVDANEGWTGDNLAQNLAACADAGVTLIEQPLPEGKDAALERIKRAIPGCAAESVDDRPPLGAPRGQYAP